MNLSTIFSYLTNNLDKLGYGVLIIVVGTLFTMLQLEKNGRIKDVMTAQDTLAAHDQLSVVYKDSLVTVSSRYVFVRKKLEDTVGSLSKALKGRDAKILALSQINSESKLENLRLSAKIHTDSVGEYVSADTTTEYYTLGIDARVKPVPSVLLRRLIIPDNSIVAFTSEGAFIKGYVTHTNPYIHDVGGSFQYSIPQPTTYEGTNYFPYVLGSAAGAVVGYLIRSATHK